jgi:putative tricarboxylic transport membrane protein
VVIAFGLLGYLLRKIGWPPAPLILGLVLGTLFESSLRQSLAMSDGSLAIFVQRPLSAALLAVGAAAVVAAVWLSHRRRARQAAAEAPDWA